MPTFLLLWLIVQLVHTVDQLFHSTQSLILASIKVSPVLRQIPDVEALGKTGQKNIETIAEVFFVGFSGKQLIDVFYKLKANFFTQKSL